MRLQAHSNARIVDPANGRDSRGTLLTRNGRIEGIAEPDAGLPEEAERHDCGGMLLCPGLVDTRVFTGQPGAEHRETLATLSAAAAAGGVTTLLVMPDAEPVIDEPAMVSFIREHAPAGAARILPVGALTRGLDGKELAEMGLMAEAGAVAFGQGRRPIADAGLLRRAMLYARDLERPIDLAPRDASLSGGMMNAGSMAGWLGLAPEAHEAETLPLMRDLELARACRVPLHCAGLSLARSVQILMRAKDEGTDVSAACTVNHLSLNENDVGDYRTYFRLEPPLRAEDDRLAMIEGLRTGAIDMICSAHDPQDADTKRLPFPDAAPGAIGLETMLAAVLRLYHSGEVPLDRLLDSMTTAPARRFGLEAGSLATGAPADFILIDLDRPWVVREADILSRSRNTPFENARMQGVVLETWVAGRRAFAREPEHAI